MLIVSTRKIVFHIIQVFVEICGKVIFSLDVFLCHQRPLSRWVYFQTVTALIPSAAAMTLARRPSLYIR